MKILHLMLGCFYIDNYSYQENYLPKYHQKQGNDVEIVASLVTFDENGKFALLPKADKYVNEYGIPVTRLDYKKGRLSKRLRRYVGLKKELERISPDLIFIHGVQFMDMSVVVKYCKTHKNVKVLADNHSDFSNSASNWISKNIQHKILWKHYAKKINPYVKKFYGVLPARVDFLVDMYGLPREKVELLVMGADDELVEKASAIEVRQNKRNEYGLRDSDIVIMTGGKIDNNKPQILTLMDAVNKIPDTNVKLLIFGAVTPSLQSEFYKRLSEKVQYIGWKKSKDIYHEFASADIVAFPGLHSVLWEEAVGMGKPCLFKKMDGFLHIDLNGNCLFFDDENENSYVKVINDAIENLDSMKSIANQNGKQMFSYKNIAKKSLED